MAVASSCAQDNGQRNIAYCVSLLNNATSSNTSLTRSRYEEVRVLVNRGWNIHSGPMTALSTTTTSTSSTTTVWSFGLNTFPAVSRVKSERERREGRRETGPRKWKKEGRIFYFLLLFIYILFYFWWRRVLPGRWLGDVIGRSIRERVDETRPSMFTCLASTDARIQGADTLVRPFSRRRSRPTPTVGSRRRQQRRCHSENGVESSMEIRVCLWRTVETSGEWKSTRNLLWKCWTT